MGVGSVAHEVTLAQVRVGPRLNLETASGSSFGLSSAVRGLSPEEPWRTTPSLTLAVTITRSQAPVGA
jgi:hypothetical protein